MTLADGYERRLAKIESTQLGFEDHGILTAFLNVKFDKSEHQGLGGYSLEPVNGAAAALWIRYTLEACGVDRWEQLKGRTIYVLYRDGRVEGIEPLPTENGKRFMFYDAMQSQN